MKKLFASLCGLVLLASLALPVLAQDQNSSSSTTTSTDANGKKTKTKKTHKAKKNKDSSSSSSSSGTTPSSRLCCGLIGLIRIGDVVQASARLLVTQSAF